MERQEKIGKSISNIEASIKDMVFTRPGSELNEKQKRSTSCEIHCDLSDERTFFAWQRNHMANERTFLAWCRTGIALIVFSFVIERFDFVVREMRSISPDLETLKQLRTTQHMGLVTFVLGAFIILLAGWRFFYLRKHINRGDMEFSALPDIFLMGSVLVTVTLIFSLFAFLF